MLDIFAKSIDPDQYPVMKNILNVNQLLSFTACNLSVCRNGGCSGGGSYSDRNIRRETISESMDTRIALEDVLSIKP